MNQMMPELKEDAKMSDRLQRKRNSLSKFRLFDFKDPSPPTREQQRKFADALRLALREDRDKKNAWEGESTGHFSSIFTGDIQNPRFFFGDFQQSGSIRVTSPKRDGRNRRGSDGFCASITR